MAKLILDDGTELEISKETANKLKKDFSKEQKSWEDCLLSLDESYYLTTYGGIMHLGSKINQKGIKECMTHVPTRKDAEQIRAEMQLRTIAHVVNGGWEYDGKSEYWYVIYDLTKRGSTVLRATYYCRGGIKFKSKESAEKAIDIGGDLWRVYFGLDG